MLRTTAETPTSGHHGFIANDFEATDAIDAYARLKTEPQE
jgi:hypothetical protein